MDVNVIEVESTGVPWRPTASKAVLTRAIRRAIHCPTCTTARQAPVYCAPLRCYCGHPPCPAYASYTDIRD